MASFVVFDPPPDAGASGLPVFVRDGFSWLGFLLPPVWLAWHRLWLEALVAVAVWVCLEALVAKGLIAPGASALSLLVSLFVGLEGSALRMAGLRRRGFAEHGTVFARTLREAEIRHAYGDDEGEDIPAEVVAPAVATEPSTALAVPRSGPALGLLSYPGSR